MVTTTEVNPPTPASVDLLPRIHSNVALAAFILAVYFPPLGFILGWVSIVSDHNDGRVASGLAKAAMLLSAIIVIGVIILIVQLTKSAPLPCDLNNPNYPACLWTTQNSSRRCG
jgi:heme A synthase